MNQSRVLGPLAILLILSSSAGALNNTQFFQRVGRGRFEPLPIPVYPIPLEQTLTDDRMPLADGTPILIGEDPTEAEQIASGFLGRALAREEAIVAPILAGEEDWQGPVIRMGLANGTSPAAGAAKGAGWGDTSDSLGPEGYRLQVTADGVLILGADKRGLIWGAVTLLQLLGRDGPEGAPYLRGAEILDRPDKSFRGIHVYLPSREDFAWFRSFAENVLLRVKLNTIVFEVSGGMEYRKHPEINIGWAELSADVLENGHRTGSDRHLPPAWRLKEAEEKSAWIGLDSPNSEPGGGYGVPRTEVIQLVDYLRELGFDVIPEMQSLTHAFYLLTRHRELAEVPETVWPDSYNPADPRVYELMADVLDEAIEVFRPTTLCIGHDEWRTGGIHPDYKGQPTGPWYAKDVLWFHKYLKQRGIRTMIWGDAFEAQGADGVAHQSNPVFPSIEGAGKIIKEGGGKDILAANWRYNNRQAKAADPIAISAEFVDQQVFGNFSPVSQIDNAAEYRRQAAHPSVIGGAPSNWTINDEGATPRANMLAEYIAAGQFLWSVHDPAPDVWKDYLRRFIPISRSRAQQRINPARLSKQADFEPLPVASAANATRNDQAGGWDLSALPSGTARLDLIPFRFSSEGKGAIVAVNRPGDGGRKEFPYPQISRPIPVGGKAASLLFCLAASGRGLAVSPWYSAFVMAVNETIGYLGIVYSDSLRTTVPLRYGLELAAWNEPDNYLYWSSLVPLGAAKQTAVSVLEWVNPRPWREVAYVRLGGSRRLDQPRHPYRMSRRGRGGGSGDSDTIPLLLAVTACRFEVPALEAGTAEGEEY
ncbi:glycoside hydrolase family 20 zincin-like fold domain-containing protein [candidate division KSB1 bacterium]